MAIIILPKKSGRFKATGQYRIDWGHPSANGLLGFWAFTEGGGLIINDQAGKIGPLTQTGGTWAKGPYGSELQYNGSSDKALHADSPSLQIPSAQFTLVTAWRITSNPSDGAVYAGKRFSFSNYSYGIKSRVFNTFTDTQGWMQLSSGGSTVTTNGFNSLTLNTEYVLTLRWQSGSPLNLRIFDIRGNVVYDQSTANFTDTLAYDTGPFYNGYHENNDTTGPIFMPGYCSFTAVSQRYWNDAELQQFAAAPTSILVPAARKIFVGGAATLAQGWFQEPAPGKGGKSVFRPPEVLALPLGPKPNTVDKWLPETHLPIQQRIRQIPPEVLAFPLGPQNNTVDKWQPEPKSPVKPAPIPNKDTTADPMRLGNQNATVDKWHPEARRPIYVQGKFQPPDPFAFPFGPLNNTVDKWHPEHRKPIFVLSKFQPPEVLVLPLGPSGNIFPAGWQSDFFPGKKTPPIPSRGSTADPMVLGPQNNTVDKWHGEPKAPVKASPIPNRDKTADPFTLGNQNATADKWHPEPKSPIKASRIPQRDYTISSPPLIQALFPAVPAWDAPNVRQAFTKPPNRDQSVLVFPTISTASLVDGWQDLVSRRMSAQTRANWPSAEVFAFLTPTPPPPRRRRNAGVHRFAYVDEQGFPLAPDTKRRKTRKEIRAERMAIEEAEEIQDEEDLLLLGLFEKGR